MTPGGGRGSSGARGRLKQVKDFDGRTVDYTLVSARLETVTGPDPQDPSSERPVSLRAWGTASGDLRGASARAASNRLRRRDKRSGGVRSRSAEDGRLERHDRPTTRPPHLPPAPSTSPTRRARRPPSPIRSLGQVAKAQGRGRLRDRVRVQGQRHEEGRAESGRPPVKTRFSRPGPPRTHTATSATSTDPPISTDVDRAPAEAGSSDALFDRDLLRLEEPPDLRRSATPGDAPPAARSATIGRRRTATSPSSASRDGERRHLARRLWPSRHDRRLLRTEQSRTYDGRPGYTGQSKRPRFQGERPFVSDRLRARRPRKRPLHAGRSRPSRHLRQQARPDLAGDPRRRLARRHESSPDAAARLPRGAGHGKRRWAMCCR